MKNRRETLQLVLAGSLVTMARPILAAKGGGGSELGVPILANITDIFGMYSGLALLMDVHHPAKPNGIAQCAEWGEGRRVKRGQWRPCPCQDS